MQAVSESPGTIESYEQPGCHGQGRRQPGRYLAGAEKVLSGHSKNIVARRHAVSPVTKSIENGCKVRQPSYMYGDDLVVPEQTMGPDVDAGR